MTEERIVTGVSLRIPPDRTDTLLLELKTQHGPFRFVLTQKTAWEVAERVGANASRLKTRSPREDD
jgi:hypothetical protein